MKFRSTTTRKSQRGAAGRIMKLKELFSVKGGTREELQANDTKEGNKEE